MLKNFYADAYFNKITDVDAEFLREHKIKGIILDIDNTLIGHDVPLPDKTILAHLRYLESAGFKLCVVSNNRYERVKSFCEKIDVKYFVYDALKPRKMGYDFAAREMQLQKNEIAAIGDQVFTDVWGAKRTGCLAILTKPLHKGGEGFFIALKRILEKPFIMKNFFVFLLCTMLVLSSALCANAIGVVIDGVGVAFTDNSGYPFIDANSRTLVPLRASMEALDATVSWDSETQSAIVKKGPTTVVCKIGEACIYRNGTKIANDASAQIINSRTYLPIRAVAEALDASVGWDGNVVITTGSAGNLIHSIENSGSHVSNLWKCWEDALAVKSSGNYHGAIELIKELAPDFIAKNDGNSRAMLYKHLGECYSALGMNAEASVCFKREADYWASVSKREETIDATRRSTLINSSVQMYAKTYNDAYKSRRNFGEKYEPKNGLYIGAYAEGDRAVHDPSSMTKFYMNEFPNLVGKDMSTYLLYMPSTTPLSNYQSHIDVAKQKNKTIQLAVEPVNFFQIQENDPIYIKLAQDMENSGAKFLLRFASEMNDTSCPWHTTDYSLYISKFRIVADIFHKYAPSVPVVWSPNFYPADNIANYYPGDAYVDYVGISSYMNHQPETDPLGQNVDRNRWSEQLDTICSLYAHKKPIIVSEGGASYMDYNTWADITPFSSNQLYDFLTYLPIKYPSVKAFYLFDNDRERYKFSLSNNSQYLSAFKNGIQSEQYLSSFNENANLPQYYELGTNVAVEAVQTEICSFIKTPANDISYVVYSIYGTDIATSYAIPYNVTVDFSPYRGTTVPLTATAFDSSGKKVAEKTYYLKAN